MGSGFFYCLKQSEIIILIIKTYICFHSFINYDESKSYEIKVLLLVYKNWRF
jgi:hypothetical protein